jgi:hypothetical protein
MAALVVTMNREDARIARRFFNLILVSLASWRLIVFLNDDDPA